MNDDQILETPLVYDALSTNTTKVLLIHDQVADAHLFYSSCNSDTFPIIYSNFSTRAELLSVLPQTIERLAFVFHGYDQDISPVFLENETLFCLTDPSNANMPFIVDVIKKWNIAHVDYLACKTLQHANYRAYYQLLQDATSVIIGASDNDTGNVKYGGDWTLESTMEDVRTIYFTDAIADYTRTLATSSITASTTIYNADIVAGMYTFPVTISGGTSANPIIVKFGDAITFSTGTSQYFIIGSQYVTVDGNGFQLTINNIANYPGFIKNDSANGGNGYSNNTIQNIAVNATGTTTLGSNGGWIAQQDFGKGATNIWIDRCSSNGAISANCGGIVGTNGGRNGGNVLITNCFSTGTITSGGGIIGNGAASNGSGTITIQNCYSTGAINGGGIVGANAGGTNGTVIVQNCYSTGAINGGGIIGIGAGRGGTITIQNCYSTGTINGGGIAGSAFGYNTNKLCSITNCYSTGTIGGTNSGGIADSIIGYSDNSTIANVSITNCYTTGTIQDSTGGGICGGKKYTYTTVPNVTISNCYMLSAGNVVSNTLEISPTISNVYNVNGGTWSDATANAILIMNTNVWIDPNPSTNTPYVLLSASYSSAYSSNGITWTYSPQASDSFAASYGGNTWLGSRGSSGLSTSTSGTTWTPLNTTVLSSATDAVWTGDRWVAMGSGSNSIAISQNSTTAAWSGLGTTVFTQGMGAIAFNQTKASSSNFILAYGEGTNTIAYSNDEGLTWTGLGTTIFSTGGYNAVFGDDFWVAVGAGTNTLAYSFDGTAWTGLGTTIFSTAAYSVAWNGLLYVAVGTGTNTIAYSVDGTTWTGIASTLITPTGYAVTYGNNLWIAGGTSTMAWSIDGRTWTAATGFTGQCNGITWNGSSFLASTAANGFYSSITGKTWTPIANTSALFTAAYYTAHNGTVWIACGNGSTTMYRSPNSTTWTALSTAAFTTAYNVVWTGSRWIAFGSSTNTMAYSDDVDGIKWTGLGSTVFTTSGRGAVVIPKYLYQPAPLLAGGSVTNTFAYSLDDGVTWAGIAQSAFTGYVWMIATNGIIYVAAGNGTNTLAYSYDGFNWTGLGTTIFSGNGRAIVWNGSLFVAVGDGTNQIAYSADGIAWTGVGATWFGSSGIWGICLAYGNGIWVAGGGAESPTINTSALAWSSDGKTWNNYTTVNYTFTNLKHYYFHAIVWTGQIFVATLRCDSTVSMMAYSADGKNWTSSGVTSFSYGCWGAAYNGKVWLICGLDSNTSPYPTMITASSFTGSNITVVNNKSGVFSTNGITPYWSGRKWIVAGDGTNAIAYTNDPLAATGWTGCGQTFMGMARYIIRLRKPGQAARLLGFGINTANTIAYSLDDGNTWTGLGTRVFTYIGLDAVYNGTLWVAVGEGTNSIAYSYDGIAWTGLGTSLFTKATGIAWNGSMFVAVGAGNSKNYNIAYSYDGIQWTGTATALFTTSQTNVAWSPTNQIWVAGGSGTNAIAWSTDAITWTGTSVTAFCRHIVWGGDKFVAGMMNSSNTIMYSTDGKNWTAAATTSLFQNACYGVGYNGAYWTACGGDTSLLIKLLFEYSIMDVKSGTSLASQTGTSGTQPRFYPSSPANYAGVSLDLSANTAGNAGGAWVYNTVIPTITASFTITGWFNALAIPGSNRSTIFSLGTSAPADVVEIFINTGGRLCVTCNNTTTVTGTNTPITGGTGAAWCHFAYTYTNTTTQTLYLNNASVGGNVSVSTLPTIAKYSVGSTVVSTAANAFKGYIADICVYNRVLTMAELTTSYQTIRDPTTATIATSPDGITWSPVNTNVFSIQGYKPIWTGKRWLAAGNTRNTIAFSDTVDASVWNGLNGSTFPVDSRGFAVTNTLRITKPTTTKINTTTSVVNTYASSSTTFTGIVHPNSAGKVIAYSTAPNPTSVIGSFFSGIGIPPGCEQVAPMDTTNQLIITTGATPIADYYDVSGYVSATNTIVVKNISTLTAGFVMVNGTMPRLKPYISSIAGNTLTMAAAAYTAATTTTITGSIASAGTFSNGICTASLAVTGGTVVVGSFITGTGVIAPTWIDSGSASPYTIKSPYQISTATSNTYTQYPAAAMRIYTPITIKRYGANKYIRTIPTTMSIVTPTTYRQYIPTTYSEIVPQTYSFYNATNYTAYTPVTFTQYANQAVQFYNTQQISTFRDNIVSIPPVTDTIVTCNATQTLSNKTIQGDMSVTGSLTVNGTINVSGGVQVTQFSSAVSIGTNAPPASGIILDICGIVQMTPKAAGAILLSCKNTSGYGIYIQSSNVSNRGNTMDFYATDYNTGTVTTRPVMTLYPTGSVGIGTTTPAATLDVNGSINVSGTTTMNGYVGIGISNTSNYLQVNGSSNTAHNIQPDGGSYHNLLLTSTKTGSTNYSMALGVDYTSGCGYINAAGNGDLQPVCLQTRGGKVGIGTQNPQATLDVYAAGTGATPQINVTSYAGGFTTTNTSALNLKIQGAGGGMVDNTIKSKYYSDSGGTYGFEFNSSGTNLMNLNGTGIYLFAPNGSSSGLFNMHKYFGTGSSSLNIFSVAISGTNSYGSCHLEIIYVGTSNGKAGYSVKVECAIVDNYGVTPQTQVYQNTTLIASGGGALSGTLVGAPSGGPGTLYSSVSSRTCTFYFSGLPTSNAIDVYVRAMVGGASGYPSNAGYYTFAWL